MPKLKTKKKAITNPDVVNTIFMENLDLAYFLANKYYGAGRRDTLLKEDIEQAALIGLWIAIQYWEKDKGTLGTVAYYYIMDEINQVRRHKGAVSIPYHQFRDGVRPNDGRCSLDNVNPQEFEYTQGYDKEMLLERMKKVKVSKLGELALKYTAIGRPLTDISDKIGKSRQTVVWHKRAAIHKIRKELCIA